MQMMDKKGTKQCPSPFQIPLRKFVKVPIMKKEDPTLFHVDSVFPEIQGMMTSVKLRPWNGIVGSPVRVAVMRKVTNGSAQYVFFCYESDIFNESTNLNDPKSLLALHLRIFRERNPFSSCRGLHFSPVAFLMSAMHIRVVDKDTTNKIDQMMNTFYEENPGDFQDDKNGPPRYLAHVDQSIGKEAFENATLFLPKTFYSEALASKFNHDLGMEFDVSLTLNQVLGEGWRYPNTFFPKMFERCLSKMFKPDSSLHGEFSVYGYFGGRHCLEVFYQCCMKWRFTTAEWDRAIEQVKALPTIETSEEMLNSRIAYLEILQFERQRNFDSFFTLEDWFRALHLAVDGKLSEGPMKEAGSPYLQETVRINMATAKPSSAGDSLHFYPNNNRPREYR